MNIPLRFMSDKIVIIGWGWGLRVRQYLENGGHYHRQVIAL